MDIYTFGICIGIFVLSIIIICSIALLTMKEKSYEEALKERQSGYNILEQHSKPKTQTKKKDKKSKKAKNENKAKSGTESEEKVSSASDDDTNTHSKEKMVELEIEAEVIDISSAAPSHTEGMKLKKRVKDKQSKPREKQKSILVNKDEQPLVSIETKEVYHKPILPKDEVELQHAHAPQEQTKAKNAGKSKTTQGKSSASPDQKKSMAVDSLHVGTSKKTKSQPVNIDKEDSTATRLVETLKQSDFTTSEIETMIELLVNKQQTSTWTKKSQKMDTTTIMKKYVDEKERELTEERKRVHTITKELDKLKKELGESQTRYSVMDQQASGKISGQQQEIVALQNRMRSTHEQHRTEMNTVQSVIQQVTEENQKLKAAVQTVKAPDVGNLQSKINFLQEELSKVKLQLNNTENTKAMLDQNCEKMREQLRLQEKSLHESQGKMSQMHEELNRSHANIQQSEQKFHEIKRSYNQLQSETASEGERIKSVQDQLMSVEKSKSEIEAQLLSVTSELQIAKQKESDQQKSLQVLDNENKSLLSQLQSAKDQTLLAPVQQRTDNSEYVERLSQKEQEISKTRSELEAKVAELDALKTELQGQKEKNNDLRTKNWKAMEALANMEKLVNTSTQPNRDLNCKKPEIITHRTPALEERLQDNSVGALKAENKTLQDDLVSKQTQLEDSMQQVADLQQQLQELRSKDDNKNTTMMAEYTAQIEALKTEVKDKDAEVAQLVEDQSALRVSNDKYKQSETQMSALEKELCDVKNERDQMKSLCANSEKRAKDLEEQLTERSRQLDTVLAQKHREPADNYDELVSKLELLKTELSRREQEVDKLIEARAHDNEKQKKEITKLNEDIKNKEDTLKVEKERSLEQQQKAEHLSEMLQSIEGDMSNQESQRLVALVEEKNLEIEKLTQMRAEEQQQMQKVAEELRVTVSDKNKELESLNEQVGHNYSRAQQASSDMAQICTQVHELKDQLAQRESYIAELNSQLTCTRQNFVGEDSDGKVKEEKENGEVKPRESESQSAEELLQELDTSRKAVAKLELQNEHYKTVLADTEAILNKLQNSVETEEKKWQTVFKATEEQTKALQQENSTLKEKLATAEHQKTGLLNGNSHTENRQEEGASAAGSS